MWYVVYQVQNEDYSKAISNYLFSSASELNVEYLCSQCPSCGECHCSNLNTVVVSVQVILSAVIYYAQDKKGVSLLLHLHFK